MGSSSHPDASSTSKWFPLQQQSNWADEPKACHNCGIIGHLNKSCHYPRHSKSVQEAPGKQNPPSQKNISVVQLIVPSEFNKTKRGGVMTYPL